MDMENITVSGDDAVESSDIRSVTRAKNGDDAETAMYADKDSGPGNEGQPFHTTHLGKVPPEIRENIFINLLALPPPYAGRNIAIQDSNISHGSTANEHQTSSNAQCYHLKKSCLNVLQTCRQIYTEAFPVFYGRKSYYAANAQELVLLLEFGHAGAPGPLAFRGDRITSLCVKDLVSTVSPIKDAVEVFPDPVQDSCIGLDPTVRSATSTFSGWKSLRKICLCMLAGEELFYMEFLFQLPGMRHGVVEFLDNSHWSIHLIYPGSEGNIQYAGNTHDSHDLKTVSQAVCYGCRWTRAEINSRASSFEEWNERYVEVDVTRMTEDAVKAAMESARDTEIVAPRVPATQVRNTPNEATSRSRKALGLVLAFFCCWPSSSS